MEEKSEFLEMAKALYQFKATITKTLSFRESEYFIIYQSSTKQKNWWQVINSKAQVGYVPSNYVISVQVLPEFLMKFIDECITLLRKESDKAGGCLPNDRQEVLLKLLERRNQVEKMLNSKIQSPSNTELSYVSSSCSSISRISPPLLLHSQSKVKHIQSTPSFQTEIVSADDSRKTSTLDRRSFSSLSHTTGEFSLEKSVSKEAVSDISGQVGTPYFETRRSTISTAQGSKEIEIDHSSIKKSTSEGETVTKETVYHIVEQVPNHTKFSLFLLFTLFLILHVTHQVSFLEFFVLFRRIKIVVILTSI